MKISARLVAACAVLVAGLHLEAAPHRRALLAGINDYTASTLAAQPQATPAPGRDWPNPGGAVTDGNIMGDRPRAL